MVVMISTLRIARNFVAGKMSVNNSEDVKAIAITFILVMGFAILFVYCAITLKRINEEKYEVTTYIEDIKGLSEINKQKVDTSRKLVYELGEFVKEFAR